MHQTGNVLDISISSKSFVSWGKILEKERYDVTRTM